MARLSRCVRCLSTAPSPKPLPNHTIYDLFPNSLPRGPPPHGPFRIDPRLLRREFLQLQARAHPDLHPPEQKSRAEATSAHINHVYKTLSSPLLRARYLLSLRNADAVDDERTMAAASLDDVAEDGMNREEELLELAMRAHEEILEAESHEDIEAARTRNDERIRRCEDRLEAAFAGDDLDAASKEAVRLRYLVNIQKALDDWEPGKPVVLPH